MRFFWFRIVIVLALAATLVGIGFAIGRDDDQDDVTSIVGSDGQETIVVRDDGPSFFPFGFLLFPLLFFLVFGLLFSGLCRRRWNGRGDWGPGASSSRLDDWHRRAHEGEARAPASAER